MIKICKKCNNGMKEVLSDGWRFKFVCPVCHYERVFKNKWVKPFTIKSFRLCEKCKISLEVFGVIGNLWKYYCKCCYKISYFGKK